MQAENSATWCVSIWTLSHFCSLPPNLSFWWHLDVWICCGSCAVTMEMVILFVFYLCNMTVICTWFWFQCSSIFPVECWTKTIFLSQTGMQQQHHGRETLIGILLFLNRQMTGLMKCLSGWMTGRIQGKLPSSFTICNICLLEEGSHNLGLPLLNGSLIFKERTEEYGPGTYGHLISDNSKNPYWHISTRYHKKLFWNKIPCSSYAW